MLIRKNIFNTCEKLDYIIHVNTVLSSLTFTFRLPESNKINVGIKRFSRVDCGIWFV